MIDKAARIRELGEHTGEYEVQKGRKPKPICKVKCQGCGGYIRSDEDLSRVEYVKTKRGTEMFFHVRCTDAVWRHGIV